MQERSLTKAAEGPTGKESVWTLDKVQLIRNEQSVDIFIFDCGQERAVEDGKQNTTKARSYIGALAWSETPLGKESAW